jgi:hypothetical protein
METKLANDEPLKQHATVTADPKQSEHKIDTWTKNALKKILTDFKMRFSQSVDMAPQTTGHCLVFPWDGDTGTYSAEVLELEWVKKNPKWSKHSQQIKDWLEDLKEITNLDPCTIQSGRFAALF